MRKSGASSYRREWSYLWDKIQDLIVQYREDSNARSVLKSLQSLQSATRAPRTKAVPAIDGGNGKTRATPPAAPSKAAPPKTEPQTPPIALVLQRPVQMRKQRRRLKLSQKAMTDAEKAKTPCIFFQMPSGCIHGDKCKFNRKAAAPKPKSKAKDTAKSRPGVVAKAVVVLVGASSLCTPVIYDVEWAADTAAGRHIVSAKALFDQGIPRDAFDSYLGSSRSPVTFHTGVGPQPGVQTLGFESNNMDFANHSCPLVRSTGIDVDSGKAFVWWPGSLPFFVTDVSHLVIQCPEKYRQYATRVDEHVPIFTSHVRFTHGAANPVSDLSGGFATIRSLDSQPSQG